MDRLLVVRCPHLLEEDEGGAGLRSFVRVVGAVEAYCPWVTVVRPGICSLPARGPARYFGGEHALTQLVSQAIADATAGSGTATGETTVEVGIADGLFAGILAARGGLVVPAGGTPDFLAPFPLDILGNHDLAELLARLGIRTLGELAALPESHVLGRFGADGVICHKVASGRTGELPELRLPATTRHVDGMRSGTGEGGTGDGGTGEGRSGTAIPARQPGFWGGTSDTDARAARALLAVEDLLGPGGVVTARLQGGRGPSERARFVTWSAHRPPEDPSNAPLDAPWPGRIPSPAPAAVHLAPLAAELVDVDGRSVAVSGRGLLATEPCRLSIEGSPWRSVRAWGGPWPVDERWWSRSRRRSHRMQVLVEDDAYLLVAGEGRWWVEATYG